MSVQPIVLPVVAALYFLNTSSFLTVSVLSSFDQCYTAGSVLTAYCTGAGLLFVLQFS